MNIAKNIKTIARDVLLYESRSNDNPVNYLDNNFEDCDSEIYSSKSRFVITAIGKSAFIANKIVARLNLTDTSSVFVHTTDAIHGDSGIIQRKDSVICNVKSDKSPEFKGLMPLLKRSGTKLVVLRPNYDG